MRRLSPKLLGESQLEDRFLPEGFELNWLEADKAWEVIRSYSVDWDEVEHITELVIPETYDGYPIIYLNFEDTKNLLFNLKKVVAPAVKFLHRWIFAESPQLEEVYFPKLEVVAESAFYKCRKLRICEVGNQCTRIKQQAFQFCVNLQKFEFPTMLEAIDTEAFSVAGLLSLDFSKLTQSTLVIDQYAFNGTHVLKIRWPNPKTQVQLQDHCFDDSRLTQFVFPKNWKSDFWATTNLLDLTKVEVARFRSSLQCYMWVVSLMRRHNRGASRTHRNLKEIQIEGEPMAPVLTDISDKASEINIQVKTPTGVVRYKVVTDLRALIDQTFPAHEPRIKVVFV